MLSNDKYQIIVAFLLEKLSPHLIFLFGSTVHGLVHDDSDLDIAFLNDQRQLDRYDLFMLAQELASIINQDVDLIDLNQASTVFQAQIIHTGKLIYCSDENKKAHFMIKALKMYARLNEERSEILKNITESGTIYEK